MGDEPENLVLKQLTALRGDVQALRDEMRDGFGKVESKIGSMATADRQRSRD